MSVVRSLITGIAAGVGHAAGTDLFKKAKAKVKEAQAKAEARKKPQISITKSQQP